MLVLVLNFGGAGLEFGIFGADADTPRVAGSLEQATSVLALEALRLPQFAAFDTVIRASIPEAAAT